MNHMNNCVNINNEAANWTIDENGVLVINNGVETLEVGALRNHKEITKVVLPDSLTKIGAYAFAGCENLMEVESARKTFKYIQDDTVTEEDDTIVFGVDAWCQVPWAQDYFGNYYITGDQLFVTFADEHCDLAVPEGVRVLKAFSMNHLKINSLVLPNSLEVIENFAFSDTVVAQTMFLPEGVTALDTYSLADCAITWAYNPLIYAQIQSTKGLNEAERRRFPALWSDYTFVLRSRAALSNNFMDFKRMEVQEKKLKEEGRSIMINPVDKLGKSIYSRLQHSSRIARVIRSKDQFVSLTIYFRAFGSKTYHMIQATPDAGEYNDLAPLCFKEQELKKEEIINLLNHWDGVIPEGDEPLHQVPGDLYEEWFWTNSGWYDFRIVVDDLMEYWLKLNPQIKTSPALKRYYLPKKA